ncbi:hypothetical protein [Paraburkholderia xenovorans]
MSDPMSSPAERETAGLVGALAAAIAAYRTGAPTGIHALDGVGRPTVGPADQVRARARWRSRVPAQPDATERAILAALADTYGAELLTHASLGYALRLIARHGGIELVQRLLWGETAADRQLAVMFGACCAAMSQLVFMSPEVFLADANAVIERLNPPPPGTSTSGKEDPRE